MCKELDSLDLNYIFKVKLRGKITVHKIAELLISRVKPNGKTFELEVSLSHTQRQELSDTLFYHHGIYVRFKSTEGVTQIRARKLTDKERSIRDKKHRSKKRRTQ